MLLFLVHFRHIPEALDNFKPDIIAYNAGECFYNEQFERQNSVLKVKLTGNKIFRLVFHHISDAYSLSMLIVNGFLQQKSRLR